MKQRISAFLKDEQRASRVILNWIAGLSFTCLLGSLAALMLMK